MPERSREGSADNPVKAALLIEEIALPERIREVSNDSPMNVPVPMSEI